MKKLIFPILFFISLSGIAQDSDLGNWIIYFGNKQINPKWNWHHEVQYRNYNTIGDLEQLLLRTGIGYNLGEKNHNLLLGYGYILSQNYIPATDDKFDINEHRIYQQYIAKHGFSVSSVQHRLRFEQRFVEDDFALRFRYFLAFNVPLNNKAMDENTWYLSIYNELFLNVQEEGDDFFDRDRLYGGLGYKLNKKLRFELGYMNQFLTDFNRDQINMMAFVSFLNLKHSRM